MQLGSLPLGADGVLPPWPPLLATRGPGGKTALHGHHAMHLVLATEGTLSVHAQNGAEAQACGVLTMPDSPHAIDAHGREVLLVFLEPESEAGASLVASLGATRLITAQERAALLDGAAPMRLMTTRFGRQWAARVASVLGGQPLATPKRVHPRVRKVLTLLRDPHADLSLDGLARAVELSPGRLMHAFLESVGIPLRPYLQWLKVQRAAAAMASGEPLEQAALGAGFRDAPQLTRTFERMLGLSPSELAERIAT